MILINRRILRLMEIRLNQSTELVLNMQCKKCVNFTLVTQILPWICNSIIIPTISIPFNSRGIEYFLSDSNSGSPTEFDSNGSLTGTLSRYGNIKGHSLDVYGTEAVASAAQESESWDFYGPAFVGVSEIKVPMPFGNFTKENLPDITIEGGEFINSLGLTQACEVRARYP